MSVRAIAARALRAVSGHALLSVSLGVMFVVSGVLKAASVRAGAMTGTVAWGVVRESEFVLVVIALAETCLGVLVAWRMLRSSALIVVAVAVVVASASALATGKVGLRPCGCFGGLPVGLLESPTGFVLRNALVTGSLIWLAVARRAGTLVSSRTASLGRERSTAEEGRGGGLDAEAVERRHG